MLLGSPLLRPVFLAAWVPNGLIVGCESLFVPFAGRSAGYLFAATAAGMLTGDILVGRFLPAAARTWLVEPLRFLLAAPYVLFFLHPAAGAGRRARLPRLGGLRGQPAAARAADQPHQCRRPWSGPRAQLHRRDGHARRRCRAGRPARPAAARRASRRGHRHRRHGLRLAGRHRGPDPWPAPDPAAAWPLRLRHGSRCRGGPAVGPGASGTAPASSACGASRPPGA